MVCTSYATHSTLPVLNLRPAPSRPYHQAAANKLKRELEEAGADDDVTAPAAPVATDAPAAAASTQALGVFKAKKSKLVAKGGAAVSTQAEILLKSGVPEEEVPLFAVRGFGLGARD